MDRQIYISQKEIILERTLQDFYHPLTQIDTS